VLKSQGICVFTYHHEAVSAWLAVGEALARSGFSCTAVLPLRGEGRGGLHSYNGTIKWDAVFVCRKGAAPARRDDTEVMVERQAVAHAQRRAEDFAEQLAAHDDIGFRAPDRLNLQRALIVASATIDPGKGHWMLLHTALAQTKSQGERGHAKT
jgi:adenine-specific DNA methylase